MRAKHVCLSILVLQVSVLLGVFYISPVRLLAILTARGFGYPPPQDQVQSRRLYVESGDVLLETTHYYPINADLSSKEYPTILIRSPYGLDYQGLIFPHVNGHYYASHGYHVLYQSTRGRYNSTGTFEPFVWEQKDGKATLEWLSKQKWFNGKLGAVGVSYDGFNVYSMLGDDAPIKISAAIPIATSPSLYTLIYRQDEVPDMSLHSFWCFMMDHTCCYHDYNFGVLNSLKFYVEHQEKQIWNWSMTVPYQDADVQGRGHKIDFFRYLLQQSKHTDEVWSKANAYPLLNGADGNIFHLIGGWYDIASRDIISVYERYVSEGFNPYLTMYGGTHMDANLVVNSGVKLAWFDHKLKGKAIERKLPVLVAVAPTNKWLELPKWPPSDVVIANYLFQPEGKLEIGYSVADNIKLAYSYTFDPLNPTPIVAGTQLTLLKGSVDNMPHLMNRLHHHKDILLFQSEALGDARIIAGTPQVEIFVSSSLAHVDFYARILDYDPVANTSMNVCDGFIRLTPETAPERKNEDSIYKVTITLDPITYEIQEGHSIMLQISSGAHPHWARNPGTGEYIGTATKFLSSNQVVHVSKDHPSKLIIPLISWPLHVNTKEPRF